MQSGRASASCGPHKGEADASSAARIFHENAFGHQIGHVTFCGLTACLGYSSIFAIRESPFEAVRAGFEKPIDDLLLAFVEPEMGDVVPQAGALSTAF
jgi:hypothetical protein